MQPRNGEPSSEEGSVAAPFRLRLLGGFELCAGDGTPLRISVKKAKALFAYLALQPGRAFTRSALATMLWEESAESQARQSLRQALSALRKALGQAEGSVLVADKDHVSLRGGAVDVDVVAFEQLVDEASAEPLERAVEMLRGAFLEGLNPRSTAYEDWLMQRRSAIRERAVRALRGLVEAYTQRGRREAALRCARRLAALEPLREEAHRRVISLCAAQGNYGEALKQYRVCRVILRRELGVQPDAQTEQLVAEIRAQRRRPPAATDDWDAPSAAQAPPAVAGGDTREIRPLIPLAVRLPALSDAQGFEALHQARQRLGSLVAEVGLHWAARPLPRAGSCHLLVFGLPPAQSDDAERAVRAGQQIQRRWCDEAASDPAPSALQVGIASGLMLTDTSAETVELSGEPLDRALALAEQAAPGEMLISGSLLRGALAFVEAMPSPSGAFRVLRVLAAGTQRRATPFVGRVAECRILTTTLEVCLESRVGQTVLIRGEAGIGKSRLLEECLERATRLGFACHRSRVIAFGDEQDRQPLQVLARGLLELADSPSEAEAANALEAAGQAALIDAEGLASLVDLLGLRPSPEQQGELAAMGEADRRRARMRVFERLVEIWSARGPLVFAVEDVHGADATTLAGVAELARVVARLPAVLLLSSRVEDEPLDPVWRGAMHGAPLTTVDLGRLRGDEAEELAALLAGDRSDFSRRCAARAGGHPLYLEQLVDCEREGEVPGGVRSLVQARLDALPAPDRLAAQAAAVLGERFSLAGLRHLLTEPGYSPNALVRCGLVRSLGERLLFAHDLVREAIADSILESRGRDYHRRAADWYSSRDPALSAEHLERAGDPSASRSYLEAARLLAGSHRYERALQLAGRGLNLARDDSERFGFLCLQGELQLDSGQTRRALAAFEAALACGLPQLPARPWLGQARSLAVLDRHQEALQALEQAEAAAATARERAEVCLLRGHILFPLGRFDACLAEQQRAFEHATGAGLPELVARAHSMLGDAWYQRGRFLTADEHFQSCLSLCREHGLRRHEIANLPMSAMIQFYRGGLQACYQAARQAARRAVGVGHLRAEVVALDVLAGTLSYSGAWEASARAAELCLERARTLGSARFETDATCFLAYARGTLGDRESAADEIERVYRARRQLLANFSAPWILGLLAHLSRRSERRRWALEEGEALLPASISHNHVHFRQLAIEVHIETGAWSEVERHAAGLLSYLEAEPLPFADLVAARGRALAAHARRPGCPAVRQELERLRAETGTFGLQAWLPALEAALQDTGG